MPELPATCLKQFEELTAKRKKNTVSFADMVVQLQQKGYWVEVSDTKNKELTPASICVLIINPAIEHIYRVSTREDMKKAVKKKCLVLITETTAIRWEIPYKVFLHQ